MSISGAALEITNSDDIPERFSFFFKTDGTRIPRRVIWRQDERIGVTFDELIQRQRGGVSEINMLVRENEEKLRQFHLTQWNERQKERLGFLIDKLGRHPDDVVNRYARRNGRPCRTSRRWYPRLLPVSLRNSLTSGSWPMTQTSRTGSTTRK